MVSDMKELLKSGRESTPIGIIDEGGYEHNNRVYSWGGISPCISSREYKDPIKVLVYEKQRNTTRKFSTSDNIK